ncbi:hypothetical protein SDC9_151701 [bioreactor metagenome]|uniref:Uncharacterized protein n=1 Tax=bioreactor metagenome TaxID=1076179 RepID=A0A645EVD4_9ZZZZ
MLYYSHETFGKTACPNIGACVFCGPERLLRAVFPLVCGNARANVLCVSCALSRPHARARYHRLRRGIRFLVCLRHIRSRGAGRAHHKV